MQTCAGDGECLYCPEYENEFKKNPNYSCKYFCKPVRCGNWPKCKIKKPECEIECWDGVCVICKINEGYRKKFRPKTR